MRTVLSYICLLLPRKVRWKFKNGKLLVKREKLLMKKLPYLFIVKRIICEMKNVQLKVEDGDREAKGKKRPVFSFDINEETFDLFFNGSQGYRAHFYSSIRFGLKANKSIISLLQNKLLRRADFSESELTKGQVKKSLSFDSAKIWICEKTSSLDKISRIPDQVQCLEIPEWVEAMYAVVIAWNFNESPNPLKKELGLLGVQAPEGYKLKVFGAWLDDNENEFVVNSKKNRSEDIRLYGFS